MADVKGFKHKLVVTASYFLNLLKSLKASKNGKGFFYFFPVEGSIHIKAELFDLSEASDDAKGDIFSALMFGLRGLHSRGPNGVEHFDTIVAQSSIATHVPNSA